MITGWMHVNVNCSDLGRARAFYEDGLGLRGVTHTAAPPQDAGPSMPKPVPSWGGAAVWVTPRRPRPSS